MLQLGLPRGQVVEAGKAARCALDESKVNITIRMAEIDEPE